jgi:hypothetical protein
MAGRTAARRVIARPASATAPGIVAWYKADAISGVADAAALSSWPDSSGNGHDLAQATTGRKPQYYKTTAGNLVNGKAAVWFSGGQVMAAAGTFPWATQPIIIQAVLKASTTSGERVWMTGGPGGFLSQAPWCEMSSSTQWHVLITANLGSAAVAVNLSQHAVTHYCLDSGLSYINVDGVLANSGGAIGTCSNGTLQLGARPDASLGWFGAVCELLIYCGSLSTALIGSNEVYLKNKWGIP